MMNNILKHGPVTMLKKPLRVNDLQETLRTSATKPRRKKRQRSSPFAVRVSL